MPDAAARMASASQCRRRPTAAKFRTAVRIAIFLSNSSAQRQLLLARVQNGAILVAPAEPLRETRAARDRTVRANIGRPSGNN
jgi:hypothetical protein